MKKIKTINYINNKIFLYTFINAFSFVFYCKFRDKFSINDILGVVDEKK